MFFNMSMVSVTFLYTTNWSLFINVYVGGANVNSM